MNNGIIAIAIIAVGALLAYILWKRPTATKTEQKQYAYGTPVNKFDVPGPTVQDVKPFSILLNPSVKVGV